MLCHNQVVGKTKDGKYYQHPCGQCLNCRINDCRKWFVRSFFEVKKIERPFNYFVTLTFDDDHLPENNLCSKPELKSFLNNLNNSFDLGLRYYAVSDYGGQNGRPHYHILMTSKKKILTSQMHRIWKKGYVYVKPVRNWNIKYICRYTVKKQPLKNGEKGFFRMVSHHWGDNLGDYFTGQDSIIIDGRKYGIPPYNWQKLEKNSHGFSLPEKKKIFMTSHIELLIQSSNYENVGDSLRNPDVHKDFDNELSIYRRRLK